MINEPSARISWWRRPTALCSESSDRKLFEQTISARRSVSCAGVESPPPRISLSRTLRPASASCHAASEPASPPPTMWMSNCIALPVVACVGDWNCLARLAIGLAMLLLILFAAAQTATLSANNYAVDEPMPPRPAVLAWADEFNGKHLDASKWSFDTSRNKQGWYNGELQYYAADRRRNLRLQSGRLIIEAHKDPQAIRGFGDWGGQQYSSAKIVTQG